MVRVQAVGFQRMEQQVTVSVGQAATANFQLVVATANETVTVNSQSQMIQTQNADVTTDISRVQISDLPNSGLDITYVAQSTPGATINTGGGRGNFSAYGLPATGNLYQMNGMDNTAMYTSVNMSGATNLTLGLNEIETATVVTNAYSGQYGRLAGSQVAYVTQSGSNNWHGNAFYNWNGRALNANNFFNNSFKVNRPFDNVNQWAASLGGPVIKNRTFFFVDFEGIRVVLPTSTPVTIPSPQFQQATLANLTKASPQSVSFYNQIFSIYKGAPGAASAANVLTNGGCGTFTALGPGIPCALQFQASPNNLTKEWQLGWRVDQLLGQRDRFFIRVQTDHGRQASSTDPFNKTFNTYSTQPEWQGQFSETHVFGTNSVNEFTASFRYVRGTFGPDSIPASLDLIPFQLQLVGGTFSTIGLSNANYTGRADMFYSVGDNHSYVSGPHTLRAGIVFRRNLVSTYIGANTAGTALATLNGFFNGQVDRSFSQTFATAFEQPLAFYNLGWYGEDNWRATARLNLTMALRFEHNSNPVCARDCYGRLASPFESLDHSINTPYNAAINATARQAFFDGPGWSIAPRIGFAWMPFANRKTAVRGGFGVFVQGLPGNVANNFVLNSPEVNSFVVTGSLSPAVAGNAASIAAASNAALAGGFNGGATLVQLQKSVSGFRPPSFYTAAQTIHDPLYREWNLEFQHSITESLSLTLNYVGNYGYHEALPINGINGYCPPTTCPNGYLGLPAAAPDPRFGTVTELQSSAESNYNGMSLSLSRRMSHGLLFTASYTYGHALDEISNGGFLPFLSGSNSSILAAQDPSNPHANYGNADYDVRHSFHGGYTWQMPTLAHQPILDQLLGGWAVSGDVFIHSGMPFTVINSAQRSLLTQFGNGETIFANYLGGEQPSCSVSSLCLIAANFSAPTAGFGRQERNQFRGPSFFDTDLNLLKNFPLRLVSDRARLSVGALFFNLFNHPNFDQPVADSSSPQFGKIVRMVSVPTSFLGVGLGGDASPRLIQLTVKITF